ncbi:MAG: UDP-glucose/GDP-mannose dehydrogenase family protein, partial [Dehalococcoidia bacterium]
MEDSMRISVVGSGYVGLVTGACLAKLGNKVILVDIDNGKIEAINNRICPIHEEGLSEILNQVRIKASSDYQCIVDADIIFLCVGTPVNDDDSTSLEDTTKATEEVARVIEGKSGYCVVVVKSTVVPGTTEEIVIPILETSGKKVGEDFGVCMSPEFLREGKAVYDFMNPIRIIIGEFDRRSGDTLLNLYQSFNAPVLRTNLRTAEMIKLASNTFLTMKISFINEIGNICKKLGIDSYEVAKGMGFDDRIGRKFLNAG